MRNNRHKLGFTLIEMSIVLIIIGLVIGTVSAGKVLIRQSQINSVASDVQKYKAAIIQFQQKYNFLPGDFPGAQTYWGTPTTACSTTNGVAANDASLYHSTCNGDGNGRIGIDWSNGNYTTLSYELPLAWQHLNLAGFIDGRYTGGTLAATTGAFENPGVNIPQSKLQGAGFNIQYMGLNPGAPYFNNTYGHAILFGLQAPNVLNTYSNLAVYSVLTAKETQALDAKIDDGTPGTGTLMSQSSGSTYTPSCATTSSGATAAYNISSNGPQCSLIFLMVDF